MAEAAQNKSSGSLLRQILIAVLIVVLLLAIIIPKRQWDKHSRHEKTCRERMQNLYFAANFFQKKTNGFTKDVRDLLAFCEAESIKVFPSGFKLDRLTREDSGSDSFLVDFFDPYQLFNHFQPLPEYKFAGTKDSVVLSTVPLERFKMLLSTKYIFAADAPINIQVDDRGDQGKFLLVGSQSTIRREQVLGDIIHLKACDYIYNIDQVDIDRCPATGNAYKVWVNVKVATQAELVGTLQKEKPETSLVHNKNLASLAVFGWLKEADALAKATLVQEKTFDRVEDSLTVLLNQAFLDSVSSTLRAAGKETLAAAINDSLLEQGAFENEDDLKRWEEIRETSYNYMNALKDDPDFQKKRDNIVNTRKDFIAAANLMEKLATLRKNKTFTLSESGVTNTVSDSVEFYSNPDLIKTRLFKPHLDSVTVRYINDAAVADLLALFTYEELYRVGRVDSVGVTIKCPIEGKFRKSDRTLLEKVFAVEGEEDHGEIENGDLSWSEKQ